MRKIIITLLVAVTTCTWITGCNDAGKKSETKTKAKTEETSGTVSNDATGTIDEEVEVEGKDLKIKDHGYSIVDGNLHWAVVVENPNEKLVSRAAQVTVTAKDKNGKVIATESQDFGYIFGNATASLTSTFDVQGKLPSKVTFTIDNGEFSEEELIDEVNSKNLVVSNPSCKVEDEDGYKFTGEVENKGKKKSESVKITILLKKDKKIVGGTVTYIDAVGENQKKAFDTLEYSLPKFDQYVMSAQSW